jgi:hypothetical protein
MSTLNNVVPLYISSRDRVSLSDSTTDFTIALKKSLRNITSLQVSNVVIPRSDTLINANNNTLSGAVIVDGIETAFSITITDGDYTAAAMATELQTDLNASGTMLSFPLTWVVSYNTSTKRMVITATYSLGATHTWAVRFNYTAAIDVIGIGSPSTTAQTFTATATSTTLSVPCMRIPNLVRALSYNITSARLTNNINTSYIKSLGKLFNVDSSNDTLKLNTSIVTSETVMTLDRPGSSIIISQSLGQSVSMSSDGNIIAVGSAGKGVFVYTRLTASGTWSQSVITPVLDEDYIDLSQGWAVAVSGDGNTLAFGDDSAIGGVYVFTRIGNDWIRQGGRLVGTGYTGSPAQGMAVALSIDGDTLAIGGANDNSGRGAVWIFVRSGSSWSQQGAKITPTGAAGPTSSFGCSVALSGTGDRMIVGGSADNTNIGGVWFYSRSGAVWSNVGGKFTSGAGVTGAVPDGTTGFILIGTNVCMSADGTRASFTGPADSDTGAAWVFLWGGAAWAYEAKIMATTGNTAISGTSAWSVALNSAADTLAIGCTNDETFSSSIGPFRGSTSIYTRSGTTWSAQSSRLVGTGSASPGADQGFAVALSSTGNDLATTGPYDQAVYSTTGALWTFTRSGTTWTQKGSKLTGTGGGIVYNFGNALAVSGDGLTMIGARWNSNTDPSSAFIYTIQGIDFEQQAELIPASTTINSRTGLSVSINYAGTLAAVGDPGDDAGNGVVSIFTRASSGTWSPQTQIARGSWANTNMGRVIRLSPSGTWLFIGGFGEGVRVMTSTIGTWVETQSRLGLGTFAGNSPASISISDDEKTMAIGASGGGLAVFTLASSGLWTIQGANLNTIYTPSSTPNGFACSSALSSDGNTLVAGSDQSDGPAGQGRVYVFTRSAANVWSQQAALVGTGGIAGSRQGYSVALGNSGNMLLMGAPYHNSSTGAVWIFDRANGVWTQRATVLVGASAGDMFGQTLAIPKTLINFLVGAPANSLRLGYVRNYVAAGSTYTSQIPITLSSRGYSIFDIVSTLGLALANLIETGIGYTITFNSATNTVTIASTVTSPAVSSTFYVDSSSTFNAVRWLSTEYKSSQTSAIIDFSINNDVLKQITNHSDNADNVIADNTQDIQYRKYPPGYTISKSDVIDIQLRNDRDGIIDLNGSDWVMTIYATIRA